MNSEMKMDSIRRYFEFSLEVVQKSTCFVSENLLAFLSPLPDVHVMLHHELEILFLNPGVCIL